ncbi:MAG: FliA/WhiG family RNA polymerase sigma factor [bacterium]|jgi:RNA polymerase sigma factor for flagellar operon FliA|nr:FliA/WhiG family RNA polymerase sigma factor [bacterium]
MGIQADQLWDAYRKDPSAGNKEALLVAYLPVVKQVAGRMKMSLPHSVHLDDLVGSGIMGLINSVENFNPDFGFKFETYAIPRIRGSILDGLRDFDWVPRSIRSKEKLLENTISLLENEMGRLPTDEEIAHRMDLSLAEYHKLVDDVSATTLLSFDRPLSGDGDQSSNLYDLVADSANDSPLELMERKEIRTLLIELINRLPEQDKLVIALYYYEELTLKEIGKVLDISESRVSQIHTKIIMSMKQHIRRLISM